MPRPWPWNGPGDFTPVIRAFLASGTLDDHWLLWAGRPGHRRSPGGAGRTRRARAAGADLVRRGSSARTPSWSQRDEMFGRISRATAVHGGAARALIIKALSELS